MPRKPKVVLPPIPDINAPVPSGGHVGTWPGIVHNPPAPPKRPPQRPR